MRRLMRRPPREMLAFVIVVPMLAASAVLHNRDVIFPEGAGLALGVLGLELPNWRRSPVRLATMPPFCALLGVALAHADLSRWTGEIAAITVALAFLHWGRSWLIPSLSAAAFPVVFDVRSWTFPLAVLIICAALAGLVLASQRRSGPLPLRSGQSLPPGVALAAWAIAAGWIIVAGPILGRGPAAAAPPLVVGMVERLTSTDPSAITGARHWAAVVAAAAIGAGLASQVDPRWVGGLLAVAAVLVVFATFSGPHPPALSICLIPQVAPEPAIRFTAAIALGTAVLYLAAAGGARRLGAAVEVSDVAITSPELVAPASGSRETC
jgi:hypothetical protein